MKQASTNTQLAKFDNLSNLLAQAGGYATQINIDLSAPLAARWKAAVEQEESSKRHFAAHGLLLLSIQSEVEHGEFLTELTKRGFEQRQAYRAMTYAQFVFSRPDSEQQKFLEMPRQKIYELAKVDTEVVDVLMQDGGDAISKTTVSGLVNELKAITKRLGDTQTKLNDQLEINAALSKKRSLSDLKASTHVIREETLANVAHVQLACGALEKLCDEVMSEDEGAPEHPLRVEQVNFAVYAAAAQALNTLARCVQKLPEGLAKEITSAHILSPEEADRWQQEWLTIQAGHRQKEIDRHNIRATELPRGKGRPASAPKAIKA